LIQQVVAILEKIFSKPGKVKYGNIHLLAILVSALYRYHQDFVTIIIDNILEYVVLGLEQNDFKFNQRRLAEVKYLGELYNYRMVDHPVIFDTMYRIMTFGHGMLKRNPVSMGFTNICFFRRPSDSWSH
jgi:regulator of nonsense transcripts 2